VKTELQHSITGANEKQKSITNARNTEKNPEINVCENWNL